MTSSELTPPEIWSLILEESKKVIPAQTFQTWLEPTRAVTLAADKLLVEAENQFAADYIEGQYSDVLNQIADGLFEHDLSIAFTRSSSAAAETEALRGPSRRFSRYRPARRLDDLGSPLNSRYVFEGFVVGKSNQFAPRLVAPWPRTPPRRTTRSSSTAASDSGRRTSCRRSATRADRALARPGLLLSSENFMNEMISSIQRNDTISFRNKYRRMDLLLIDDVQFLANKESTQEEFFHTFNALYDAHKQIVLTSDRPPKEIPTLESG